MEKYNTKIIVNKCYKRKSLYQDNNYKFVLIGEVDGFLDDGTIVEIKNRKNRLFKRIYNYEKVQMYAYLYLWNRDRCILI